MENRTLEQLADEYQINIKNTDKLIDICRENLCRAQKEHRNILVTRLTRELAILYDQRNELRETEAHLRNYYNREMRCAG